MRKFRMYEAEEIDEDEETLESAVDTGLFLMGEYFDQEGLNISLKDEKIDEKNRKVVVSGKVGRVSYEMEIRLLGMNSWVSNFSIDVYIGEENRSRFDRYSVIDDGYLVWTEAIQHAGEFLKKTYEEYLEDEDW